VHGIGTGSFGDNLRALGQAGVAIFASGMSAKARAVEASAVADVEVQFALPNKLVELTMTSDRVLTY
jgi:uncharacterized protein